MRGRAQSEGRTEILHIVSRLHCKLENMFSKRWFVQGVLRCVMHLLHLTLCHQKLFKAGSKQVFLDTHGIGCKENSLCSCKQYLQLAMLRYHGDV